MSFRIIAGFLLALTGASIVSAKSVSELSKSADLYIENGNYPAAVSCYEQIMSQLPLSDDFMPERIQYAKPYSDALIILGNYEKVETLLSVPEYDSDPVLQINLASSLGYQGKYDESFEILDKLESRKDIAAGLHGIVVQNKGYLSMEKKDYQQAEICFRRAAEMTEGMSLELLNTNLALCLAREGKKDEAVRLIGNSVNALKKAGPQYFKDYVRALRKYAEILLLVDRRKEGYEKFRQYFDLEREWLCGVFPTMTISKKLNLWLSERPLVSKCFLLEDYDPDFSYEVAMFRRLMSIIGMEDVEGLKKLLNLNTSNIRKSLKKGEAALEFVCYTDKDGNDVYAAAILPYKGSPRFIKLFGEEFTSSRRADGGEAIVNLIKSDRRNHKRDLYTDTVTGNALWFPIINALPRDIKKIYFAPEGILHLWGIENMPFDGKNNIELHRVTSTAFLSQRDRKTERKSLKGKKQHTLLVGGLNYNDVPDDLPVKEAGHEAASILKDRIGKNNVFAYLPGTRAEVDSIGKIYDEAELRYSVGESEFKSMLPNFRRVHVATHGYSLEVAVCKRPEALIDSIVYDPSLNACGLALTGANIMHGFEDLEDGIISARELCDVDLSNVDLIVMSACQSAVGNVSDEGPAGLVRGLKNAGARTILATLWSVDDNSTRIFMCEFYSLLEKGLGVYEAFRGAQDFLKNYSQQVPYKKFSPASLARSRNESFKTISYEDPYFWAPFILIDE